MGILIIPIKGFLRDRVGGGGLLRWVHLRAYRYEIAFSTRMKNFLKCREKDVTSDKNVRQRGLPRILQFVLLKFRKRIAHKLFYRFPRLTEHRKADFGSWKQAQQKARVFGESVRSPLASSAKRGFPYWETRICQSAQRPYSRTRCVSHEACFSASISSRFTSQKRWLDRASISLGRKWLGMSSQGDQIQSSCLDTHAL